MHNRLLALAWRIGAALLSLRYAVVAVGAENVPEKGAVLLLGNHVSWLDWMLVQIPLRRRLRFLMDRGIYEWKSLHWMFRFGRVIPISPRAAKGAFVAAQKALQSGEAVAIFPEGAITRSCETEKFYRGFEIIAQQVGQGVIVPFYIDGMCGSVWSYSAERYVPRRRGWRRVVTVVYGKPMPIGSDAAAVREAVVALKENFAQ